MDKEINELKKYGVEPMRIDNCKIEQVIVIEYICGLGTKESPIQKIYEYRTLAGEIIGKITF